MKKPTIKSLVTAFYAVNALASVSVHAQSNVLVPGVSPIIAAAPGKYDILNSGQVLQQILSQATKIQDADRAYLISVEQQVRSEYMSLQKEILTAFAGLSNQTMNGSGSKIITAEDYIREVQKIQQLKDAVETSILSLSSVAESLPSAASLNLEGTNQSAGSYFNIKFDKLIKLYAEKLNQLMADANLLKFKVMQNNGVAMVISENALNPKFDVPLYTDAQLAEFNAEIEKLNGEVIASTLNDSEDAGNQAKDLVGRFVRQYGEDERYRFHGNEEKDKAAIETYYGARNKAYLEIANTFWTRSYLRAKYGMQLGAIQPLKYVKKIANIDKFTVRTQTLSAFRQELARSKGELATAFENMRNFMIVADERSQEIFGANKGLSNGKNMFAALLVKANALKTFVAGNTPNAQVSLMVARLVFADIMEEQMLTENGGRAQLFNYYKTRYQSTEENQAVYTAMKCNFDKYFIMTPAGKQQCEVALGNSVKDVSSVGAGDINATMSKINDIMTRNGQKMQSINKRREQIMLSVISSGSTVNDDATRL